VEVNVIADRLKPLCVHLEQVIKAELADQGHIATGKLRDSIKVSVSKALLGFDIVGTGEKYGQYVDRGRAAGMKRVPIQALVAWIRVKGIPLRGRKEIDMAWAIQTNIWKYGIPTDKDPRKKQFISRTLEGNIEKIRTDIREVVGDLMTVYLHNIIQDVKVMIQ